MCPVIISVSRCTGECLMFDALCKLHLDSPSSPATVESKPVPAPISSTALSIMLTCCWLFSKNWLKATAYKTNSRHHVCLSRGVERKCTERVPPARSERRTYPWIHGCWCRDQRLKKSPCPARSRHSAPRCSSCPKPLVPSRSGLLTLQRRELCCRFMGLFIRTNPSVCMCFSAAQTPRRVMQSTDIHIASNTTSICGTLLHQQFSLLFVILLLLFFRDASVGHVGFPKS